MSNLILATLAGIALNYYYKLDLMYSVGFSLAVFVACTLVTEGSTVTEGFVSAADESRVLHYGDTITIWTWRNAFIRPDQNSNIGLSSRLSSPEEIPRRWVYEYVTIEDANDPTGPGNHGPVKFGDTIYLKTWNEKWISPQSSGNVKSSSSRGPWGKLILESPDISGKSGENVRFGDMFYLKTWRKTYLTYKEKSNSIAQAASKDYTCLMRVYDRYGQGPKTDWARRGTATQSSNQGHYPAVNAIDGNFMSFNHTQEEQNAWWQVRLPKEVYIEKIIIKNRQDCCKDRLNNFDVIVMNANNKAVVSKYQKDSADEYTINGINRIGRIVRIQLRGKNYLHLGEVRVYGRGVDYSTLLENPVVSDLITAETTLTEKSNRVIYNEDMPYVGTNKSSTVSFFIKPTGSNNGTRTVLRKGNDKSSPHMYMSGGKIGVSFATSKNANHTLSSPDILANGQWSHIALVVDSGVSPSTGWLYGEFDVKPTDGPDKCCYAVNTMLKQYYYLKDPLNFKNSTKNTWNGSLVSNMTYMGELTSSKTKSHMTIYVNGRKSASTEIATPLHNKDPMYVGKPDSVGNGGNFAINNVKFYNYAVRGSTIRHQSIYQSDNVTLDLVRGEQDTNKITIIPAHMQPAIKDKCTVTMWLYSNRDDKGTRKWDTVYVKKNKNPERAPAMWFWPTSNKLHLPIQTVGGKYWGDGIRRSKKGVLKGTWVHLAQVVNGQKQLLYMDGKLVNNSSLPGKVNFTVSPISIGGFPGKIKDFRLSNFAMNAQEVIDSMGRHPDFKHRQEVMKIWKSIGCITDLFKSGESHGMWVNLVKSNNNSKLEDILKSYKSKADKGDKNMQKMCFGPFASKLYNKLKKKDQLLKYALDKEKMGKQCLPIAPFNCVKKDVNDFDIRTHKDFYKYTLTSRIVPPAQSAKDISIDQHPDYARFKKHLDEAQKTAQEMKQLNDKTKKQNKKLEGQMNSLEQQQGPAIRNHPEFIAMQEKLTQGQKQLQSIKNEQESTQQALAHAQEQANVKQNPEYKKMAEELKHAKKAAAANLAKSMDINDLKSTPMFKNILKNLMKNEVESSQKSKNQQLVGLEENLQKQKQQLMQVKQETLLELQNTRKLASDVFSGIAGMDANTIKNIIQSKQEMSENPEYQEIIAQAKRYSSSEAIKSHPEYQKLLSKLNQINKSEVEGNGSKNASEGDGDKFRDLKTQSAKCRAIFESNAEAASQIISQIPGKTLTKLLKEKVQSDPEFRALARNIVSSRSEEDSGFADLLAKAQSGNYKNDPSYNKFLNKIIRDQIKNNPVYTQMAMDLLTQGDAATLSKIIQLNASNPAYQAALTKAAMKNPKLAAKLKAIQAAVPQTPSMIAEYKKGLSKYRIEDHPEYNKFAREMKSQCLTKPKKGGISCYSCKVPKNK